MASVRWPQAAIVTCGMNANPGSWRARIAAAIVAGSRRRLLSAELTAEGVAGQVGQLLDDPRYRAAAAAVAAEIAAIPPARSAVPVLESLAA